jgi:hypothetical protein
MRKTAPDRSGVSGFEKNVLPDEAGIIALSIF